MTRIWFLVLALSLGLNVGLLYVELTHRDGERGPEHRPIAGDEQKSPEGSRGTQPPRTPDDFESVIRSHLDRMTRDLHLDPGQRSAISSVHESWLPRITAVRREMETLRREVAGQYAQPDLDPATFRVLVRQLSHTQARLDSLVSEAILGEASVLTFDQRERYLRQAPWGSPMLPPDRPPREEPVKGAGGDRDRPPKGPPPEPGERRSGGGAGGGQ
jgi:hypothetical protein